MPSIRRVLLCLPLAAAGSALWIHPSVSQGRAAGGGAEPLLHGVARMSCGSARPWTYGSLTTPRRAATGPGSLAAQGMRVTLNSAELVGTLQLTFGGEPRRGMADAERPLTGSWRATQLGYCTGGRGPLQLAVITPSAGSRPARFELRGPASHIQRPGSRELRSEGGEVRFSGTCGRRQQVVMEIWPRAGMDARHDGVEPERYYLVGTVTCAGAATGSAGGTTPTATP